MEAKQNTFGTSTETGHFAPVTPYFRVIKRASCKVPRSIIRKAKQARFKCNIPHFLSHKPKQGSFKYNIPRSKIGG